MLRTAALVLVLLVAGSWAVKLKCRDAVPDFKLKQRQINHLVDKINKPIYSATYQSTDDLVEEGQMRYLGMLPKHEPFSLFDETYLKETLQVIKLLRNAKDFDHFLRLAEVIHDRVNEDLFLYCLSVVLLHRNDTQGLHAPSIHKVYPDKFLPIDVITKMKDLARESHILNERAIVDACGDDKNYLNPNDDVKYFLEDVGMNAHHYNWHVMYPPVWTEDDLDRKGELFYWMHKQMVNRYDAERVSNHLPKVKPLDSWDDPIEEGYAPHLAIDKLGYRYAYRPPHMTLKNLPHLTKNDMTQWAYRLLKAAHTGAAIAKNDTVVMLDEEHGIDILGSMVESSLTSINRKYYGNLHNYAHVIAGKVTDPQNHFGGNNGAMYDVPTSARDPLFYSWHKYIDEIFQAHKKQLKPYTKEEIDFPKVKLTNLVVKCPETSTENVIHTYWQKSAFKVPQGFTFTGKTAMKVQVKHLQHEDFTYEFEVDNADTEKKAIVRIYLINAAEEVSGQEKNLNELRDSAIELDKFTMTLKAGKNTYTRCSNESTLVTPWSHIFEDHYKNEPMDHCHCGWPDYMLLPKGTYQGMPFLVFMVINDWEEEKVDQPKNCHCPDSVNYCGDADRQYPTKRALGFPLDRPVDQRMFHDWATPNIMVAGVKIKFTGKTQPPKMYQYYSQKH